MTNPILLMTRARAASEGFVARLRPETVAATQVIHTPLVGIVPTGPAHMPSKAIGAIFTSQNGVALGPEGDGKPAYCVGVRTAAQAQARGWNTTTIAQNAESLVAQIEAEEVSGPLVHFAGAHRRGDIAARLSRAGIKTDVQVLYDQVLAPLSDKAKACLSAGAGEVPVVLPLFSPRVAAHLSGQGTIGSHVRVLAISAAVADALGDTNAGEVIISPAPKGEEMVLGVENLLHSNRLT